MKHCKVRPTLLLLILVAPAVLCAAPPPVYSSHIPGDIAQALDTHAAAWIATVFRYAKALFAFLMGIDLTVTAIQSALGSGTSELKEWGRVLIAWILQRGFWMAVLVFGTTWVPAIISSFQSIGMTAAGLAVPVSPSGIFNIGIDLMSNLLNSASGAAWLTDPGSVFLVDIGALLVMAAFTVMTLQLIITTVESYQCLSVGYIFLGFGGSRWTDPHARNYLNLAIAIGTKLLLVYSILQLAMNMIKGWQQEMQNISSVFSAPLDVALDITFGSILLAACAWLIPKSFSSILSGTLNGHHGDVLAPVVSMAGIASMGASMALRSAGMAANAGAQMSRAAGGGGTGASGSGAGSYRGSRGGGGGSGRNGGGSPAPRVDPPAIPGRA